MAYRAGRNNAAAAGGDDAASVSAFFAEKTEGHTETKVFVFFLISSYNIACGAERKADASSTKIEVRFFIGGKDYDRRKTEGSPEKDGHERRGH